MLWEILAEAELYSDSGRLAYERLISRKDGRDIVGIRAMRAFLIVRRSFYDRELSTLPEQVEEFAISGAIVKELGEGKFLDSNNPSQIPRDFNFDEWTSDIWPTAILSALSSGADWAAMISAWRKSAKKTSLGFDFERVFNRIVEVLQMSFHDVRQVYQNANATRSDRLLASMRLAVIPESPLAACFIGCVTLVTDEWWAKGFLGQPYNLGILIRNVWRRRLAFKAEFALARISVPAIEEACDKRDDGIKLAAEILLAARNGVNSSLPGKSLMRLREIANGPNHPSFFG